LFPLPPLDPIRRTPILKSAADSLDWATFPTPLAIASRPYQGRGACVRCTECVGFACPSGAKAGSHNTYLPRAIASGATVISGAVVAQIDVDAHGQHAARRSWCQMQVLQARPGVLLMSASA
jgi:choline dehydrogenase-like flavoprotein